MSYVDMMGESHDIGAVKIGQENMEKGQRSPALPVQFNQLPADCFSLGQSDFYYENINHLGDGIREQILANMRDPVGEEGGQIHFGEYPRVLWQYGWVGGSRSLLCGGQRAGADAQKFLGLLPS